MWMYTGGTFLWTRQDYPVRFWRIASMPGLPYDLAMAFFYVIPHACETRNSSCSARRAFQELIAGYAQKPARPLLVRDHSLFLKLREIDLYIAIHRSLDLDHLEPWTASFMRGRKANIDKRRTYVDFSCFTDIFVCFYTALQPHKHIQNEPTRYSWFAGLQGVSASTTIGRNAVRLPTQVALIATGASPAGSCGRWIAQQLSATDDHRARCGLCSPFNPLGTPSVPAFVWYKATSTRVSKTGCRQHS